MSAVSTTAQSNVRGWRGHLEGARIAAGAGLQAVKCRRGVNPAGCAVLLQDGLNPPPRCFIQ